MIDAGEVEKALRYLAKTDEEHARAKALVKALEQSLKTTRGLIFLDAQGTVAEREARSYGHDAYQAKLGEYKEAIYDYELLENKRTRAVLTIDLWRTVESSRRAGNIR